LENQTEVEVKRVVVIGAGIGGLTTAAVLAKAGFDVTVLEAQVYPGGCASTYFHQGYRFDSGATVAAGFYPGGPMDRVAQAAGITAWPTHPVETAMVVHLPDGTKITRWTNQARLEEYQAAFGNDALRFFKWQEQTADALWDLAMRLPSWPPKSFTDIANLIGTSSPWLAKWLRQAPALALDALRPVAAHLNGASDRLRLFVDAQLLISSQATSERANALYGAAALDLPRRGVVQLDGGMGAVAETLVGALRGNGGNVLYRQEVTTIQIKGARPAVVKTKRGDEFLADVVISNLTPWNTAELIENELPHSLKRLPSHPEGGWGAFVVYVGFEGSMVQPGLALHHQIIIDRPLGEGNTVFASLSSEQDISRAPAGHRALTLSTHTALEGWWKLFEHDHSAYEARKALMTEKLFLAAERAIPGLSNAARLVLPGTPVTFQRFTRRKWGWVGGFPQTSLTRSFGPRQGRSLYLVGDSIFPGQSTAAVALGGLRVAELMLKYECEGVDPTKH
jgi:C-3',4' desaturase CrtD